MAVIKPLRGFRYDERKAGNIKDLVTPPYDVIDLKAQERYYEKNPYNVIRLEYGKKFPDDNEAHNRYTRAAAFFHQWEQQGILREEKKPALYLYKQRFTINNLDMERTGITCGVKLEPYAKGVVLPHEETIPGHKADRLALMRACRANFSPIFGLYSEPDRNVDQMLESACKGTEPAIEFTDEWGHEHRLWVIDDTGLLEKIQDLMEPLRIFIADGHHRYETALNYALENPDNPAAGYVMMTLVNLYDPGLVVLPTHRLIVSSRLDTKLISEALREDFEVAEYTGKDVSEIISLIAEMAGIEEPGGQKNGWVYGMYTGKGTYYVLKLRNPEIIEKKMPADRSPEWCRLDVSVLQKLVMEKILGIDNEALAGGEMVRYTRDASEAVHLVDREECRIAFLMNPTGVKEVTTIAEKGEKMPQKSTFFYPKLITGLVINKL